jgi:hypothetical protein
MTALPRTSAPPVAPSVAADAVGEVAARARGISLAVLLDRVALQVRLDRKYLVAAEAFKRFQGGLDVLEIDGRRCFDYESRYFDTPDRLTYHNHVMGRPDRFKLRTRSYLDSGETMLEIKLQGSDGVTDKRRIGHRFAERDRITPGARRHFARALHRIGRSVPRELVQTCVISYRRTTFAAPDGSARITCDHGLRWTDTRSVVEGFPDHVLVEVKSADAVTAMDRALTELGVAPVSLSKYCVGQALLHPELPSGPWA